MKESGWRRASSSSSIRERAGTLANVCTFIALLGPSAHAAAQSAPSPSSSSPPFEILGEASYAYFLDGSRFDYRHYLNAELGLLWNYHPRASVGFVVRKPLTIDPGESSDLPWAFEMRFRRTVTTSVDLELGAGYAFDDFGSDRGFASHIGFSHERGPQLFVHADHVDQWLLTGGVGFTHKPGLAALAIALLLRAFADFAHGDELLIPGESP